MPSKPKFYLETAVVLELLEKPKDVEPCRSLWNAFEAAENGECELVSSVLVMTEVLFAKAEADRKAVSPAVQAIMEKLWHPDSSPIRLIEVHELIARDALALVRAHLAKGWQKTKGNDAIHLITAKREKVTELWTTEHAMTKWGDVLGFKVCHPHYEKPEDEAKATPLFDRKTAL